MADAVEAQAENELTLQEALNGAPDFFEIPEGMQKQIEEQVEARERFFWLAAKRIPQNIITRSLLRRAIYAEVRVTETECRLGEMGLICQAAQERITQLQDQLTALSKGEDVDVPNDVLDFSLEGKK